MSLWTRIATWARRSDPDPDKPSLGDRLSAAMLKAETGGGDERDEPATVEELEAEVRRADDKERLIGLLAAPVAGMIAVIVTGSLIGNDPKLPDPRHVNPSTYLEVGTVAIVLSAVMLATAFWRKRLYLCITMALYGLSIFNLRFWGFGLPFLIGGAWYLVRAYRLQQKLKAARAALPQGGRGQASKRYTPPSSTRRTRANGDERRAG
jgi:hypothetical protein